MVSPCLPNGAWNTEAVYTIPPIMGISLFGCLGTWLGLECCLRTLSARSTPDSDWDSDSESESASGLNEVCLSWASSVAGCDFYLKPSKQE